ncbi:MAG: hypothetical protein LBD08_07865 [Treponema sp.]|nr:hypothetical protein [Treponema sp.]
MKEMTDEEADALDEYYTKNPPRVDSRKNGGFAKPSFRLAAPGRLSGDYLLTQAIAAHKPPTEVISEPVREKIAAPL